MAAAYFRSIILAYYNIIYKIYGNGYEIIFNKRDHRYFVFEGHDFMDDLVCILFNA